jgi:integrase
MANIVKSYPLAKTNGLILTTYANPLSERTDRRCFPSMEAALAHKREIERHYNINISIDQMNVRQLLVLQKQEEPRASIFARKNLSQEFWEIFGDFFPNDLTADLLEGWLLRRAQDDRGSEGTILQSKVAINSFFRFLVAKKVITETPLTGLVRNRINAFQRKIFSEQEISEILSEAKRLSPGHLYPMVFMTYETAAKQNEILSLKWASVDLKRNIIFFPSTPRRKPHQHQISKSLMELLETKKRVSPFVFPCPYGQPMDRGKLSHALREFH